MPKNEGGYFGPPYGEFSFLVSNVIVRRYPNLRALVIVDSLAPARSVARRLMFRQAVEIERMSQNPYWFDKAIRIVEKQIQEMNKKQWGKKQSEMPLVQ
jgi:hypothetical protein